MTSLAQKFASSGLLKVKWKGAAVHSLVQLDVKAGDTINVRRISSSSTRAQAIKVAVDKGTLRANGVLMETVAIWTHTSPDLASLEVIGRRARSIDVWNSWSFEGVDSSWIGNAGMTMETSGEEHILRCSDGLGETDFDDLVVGITVVSDV